MSGECEDSEKIVAKGQKEDEGKRIGVRRFDIIPLVEGRRGENVTDTSSVSLIRTSTSTVVVDSGSSDIKEELKEAIHEKGIQVERVNVLVTTKAHELHTGNDGLFVHALQHLQKDDWTKVEGSNKRKIAISNRYHWIDRYLRLQTLSFIEGGALVLLCHMPNNPELLEPTSRYLTGKMVLFAGYAVPSKDDPTVDEALSKIREQNICSTNNPGEFFTDLTDLLSYCDHVIPAYGPMFKVRNGEE
ncbi:MAG: hypothetical protein R6V01_11060 [Thermoplasmatota archaeon]